MAGALGRAGREGWTAVIFRLDSPDEVTLPAPLPGAWALTGQYVSRSGRLLLFVDRERIRDGIITGGEPPAPGSTRARLGALRMG
ncbi:MAG: hypothetical protein BWZ02_02446 [Lentisphaerae bacterium ADurb.BinA184]|nr:MAG: hypothetical protein BWZ02_02446 [Lentisphaerae bacterium ADurb.BinA184]